MIKDASPLPGYPEPYDLLCAILQDATVDWRAELWEDVGADAVTWRVRPGGPSIGAVMLHMMQVEIFWLEMFVLGRRMDPDEANELMWADLDVDKSIWPDPPAQPLTWYFAWHDRIRARMLESIKEWPAPDTKLTREGEPNLYTPGWVLGHVIQHETYHGGQIVMLHDLWKAHLQAGALG